MRSTLSIDFANFMCRHVESMANSVGKLAVCFAIAYVARSPQTCCYLNNRELVPMNDIDRSCVFAFIRLQVLSLRSFFLLFFFFFLSSYLLFFSVCCYRCDLDKAPTKNIMGQATVFFHSFFLPKWKSSWSDGCTKAVLISPFHIKFTE